MNQDQQNQAERDETNPVGEAASGVSRRDFLKTAAGAAALPWAGMSFASSTAAPASGPAAAGASAPASPPNILFLLTDQERLFRPGELPIGYELPAHAQLMRRGTTYVNHRINSCVCTPSRSVVYTGQQIQHTRMFDNTNFPWIESLSPEVPTVGSLLRAAGYYTAYKGKWHLTKEFETVNTLGTPTKIFTQEMEAYGFSDYFGVGDIIAHDRGGWLHDGIIASMAVSWMRSKGRDLAAQGKPWFLAVNLVNPHDVMFYDTSLPGDPPPAHRGLANLARDPNDPLYRQQWDFQLPQSFAQNIDAQGRPPAHRDFLRSHDALVGEIPADPQHWRRRHNYYLNCLRDVDRNIAAVLAELDASGLADNTIIVLTADHGDMDGAHKLHAKGAVAYREQNNVPLIVVHPRHAGGKQCQAVTSHVDLAPTLLSMTGVSSERAKAIGKGLPGKDFSPTLAAPENAGLNSVREGSLFCYNMLAYLDGDSFYKAVEHLNKGGKPADLKAAGVRPDLQKRGAVRAVFDGRYTYARYFSPKQHNLPNRYEALLQYNDIELYDTQADPQELNNLAAGDALARNRDLVMAMNDKLNRLIENEVGEDKGQMMPGGIDAGWEVTPETMAGA